MPICYPQGKNNLLDYELLFNRLFKNEVKLKLFFCIQKSLSYLSFFVLASAFILMSLFTLDVKASQTKGDLILLIDQSYSMLSYDSKELSEQVLRPIINIIPFKRLVLVGFSEHANQIVSVDSDNPDYFNTFKKKLNSIKPHGEVTDFTPALKFLIDYKNTIALPLFISDGQIDIWDRGRKYLSQRVLSDRDYADLNQQYDELKKSNYSANRRHDKLNAAYQQKNIAITHQYLQQLRLKLSHNLMMLSVKNITPPLVSYNLTEDDKAEEKAQELIFKNFKKMSLTNKPEDIVYFLSHQLPKIEDAGAGAEAKQNISKLTKATEDSFNHVITEKEKKPLTKSESSTGKIEQVTLSTKNNNKNLSDVNNQGLDEANKIEQEAETSSIVEKVIFDRDIIKTNLQTLQSDGKQSVQKSNQEKQPKATQDKMILAQQVQESVLKEARVVDKVQVVDKAQKKNAKEVSKQLEQDSISTIEVSQRPDNVIATKNRLDNKALLIDTAVIDNDGTSDNNVTQTKLIPPIVSPSDLASSNLNTVANKSIVTNSASYEPFTQDEIIWTITFFILLMILLFFKIKPQQKSKSNTIQKEELKQRIFSEPLETESSDSGNITTEEEFSHVEETVSIIKNTTEFDKEENKEILETEKNDADDISHIITTIADQIDSLETDKLELIQEKLTQQITESVNAERIVKRKLVELGKIKYNFDRKVDLCVDLKPCQMHAFGKIKGNESVSMVINLSMRGALISVEGGIPDTIERLKSHLSNEEFDIIKSHMNRISALQYEVIIDEFRQHTADKMRWIEMLSRINS